VTRRLFISYSHRDDHYLDRLHVHLAQAMRDGVFQGWYDRDIAAGGNIDDEVGRELELADVFVALVSPDFIASDYCYDKELSRALERRKSGSMVVVPVVVEACDWTSTPLGKLKALPTDGKPVAEWTNENVAFTDVVRGLRNLASGTTDPIETKSAAAAPPTESRTESLSTSRFRVKKNFGRIDKDEFADAAFATMGQFFERSVEELNRVDGLKARFVSHSPVKFSCAVENVAYGRDETVWVRRGGPLGEINIAYGRFGEDPGDNISNGGFSVQADEYELFLSSQMFHFSGDKEPLDGESAGRIIWNDLLQHVGIESA
jgi:hypothetical protein